MEFVATREAGLSRLSAFLPRTGAYARMRNHDVPGHPHVSQLSPWLRHRLIDEEEVLRAVIGRFAPSTVEKFVQEVFWRTYWKGWLEMRPSVWMMYQTGLNQAWADVQSDPALQRDWKEACAGQTGIACFDHWAQELVTTGYLHNHARMWFASIWIFTLRLPWELGADFFLRHLLDGDPASNTLGWRWVGGLQTPGKTYLARSDNIRKYTDGRFDPKGQLATFAPALDGPPNPPKTPLPEADQVNPALRTGVLLTYEDLTAPHVTGIEAAAFARLEPETTTPVAHLSPDVTAFRIAALDDAAARWPGAPAFDPVIQADELVAWARGAGLQQIVTSYPPVGPVADELRRAETLLAASKIRLVRLRRDYDSRAWPYATAGFFKFKDKIPKLLSALDTRQMSLPI